MKTTPIIKIAELLKTGEASLQTGPFGTQLKASDYVEKGVPVINVRNVGFGTIRKENLEYLDERMVEKLAAHQLKQGDIVFGRKGAVERHAFITDIGAGWIQGSDCLRLRINSERINNRFISYFFNTAAHQDWMQAVCSFGATMASLNQDIVKLIAIPMLSKNEQDKIVTILSAYDDLIENNKRRIVLLENMAEEIYREWFVRFRFPGYQTAEFEKGIPRKWETKVMRDLVSYYVGGGWGEDNESPTFTKGAYVIRGTDIPSLANGNYSKRVFRYHKPSNYKSRKLDKNDFIFEVSGGSKDQLLGRNIMVSEGLLSLFDNEVICASFCKQIRFDTEKVSNFFMKYYLKLFYECDLVGIYQVQSTGISNYQFESFLNYQTIQIPEKRVLDEFDKVVEPLIKLQETLAFENLSLNKAKDSLLPRLISGKLSVEDLDIQFPPSMQEDSTA